MWKDGQPDRQTQHRTPLALTQDVRDSHYHSHLHTKCNTHTQQCEAAAERSHGKVNLRWLACSIEIFLSALNRRGRGGEWRREKAERKKKNNIKMDGALVMQMKDNIMHKAEA